MSKEPDSLKLVSKNYITLHNPALEVVEVNLYLNEDDDYIAIQNKQDLRGREYTVEHNFTTDCPTWEAIAKKWNEHRENEDDRILNMTFAEFSDRWGMSDRACNIVGINPYCLSEGMATDSDTIEITLGEAKKLGMSKHEFNARV